MSFMKKMLSSIGIGSAKVDTQLHSERVTPGEMITGVVVIEGGDVQQNIDAIYLALMSSYIKEVDDRKVTKHATVAQYKMSDPFTIGPNERKEIEFSYVVPADTPITVGRSQVWVQTGLDIKNAVDPSDRDYVTVQPHSLASAVFESLSELGFKLRQAENEAAPYRLQKRLPFIQEFEFVPVGGPFAGKLDELEVVFFFQETECELLIEVDRRARGLGGFLAEMLDADESVLRVRFTENDVNNLTETLQSIIQKYS